MSHKLRTREGLDRYARRKCIVEPVNGQVKEIGGFVNSACGDTRRLVGNGPWCALATT
jgi:hypothetical protein